jgi:predicted ATPase/DNA-binding SARP family transcriptional activator
MLFRVLGPLEVSGGQATVPRGAGPRALLTALLLAPNSVVPAHRLAEAVWGADPPDRMDNALHQVVTRVRRALGSAGAAVVTRPPGYLLVAGASSIDAACFETQYRSAMARSAADPGAAVVLLDEALAWWRGPAYAEFADGFARPAATHLEELRLAAREDRAALLLAAGSTAEAVAAASDLAAENPLRERPVEVLMQALYAAGRTAEALEAYRRHREHVAGELGLDPTPGLRDLEARILREDPDLPARGPIRPPSPGSASAPASSPGRALPWRPSTLIGREDELRLLAEAVTTRRLVTVVGPGGVGKTRLALEVAHLMAERGRTVWWADLTTVEPDRLVDTLAEATGADLPPTHDRPGALCAALRIRRDGVLCLDNAEHLLDALAVLVERLTASAPNLVVLATSRERLALDAESVRVLAPLPLPAGADRANAAVQLFLQRVPDLEPDSLTEEQVGLVAELCRGLDGLPLAIELGAARAAALGLRGLADRLRARLDLLAGGRRTAAARHRTLRAVVDWSYELLSPDEARLFGRLAVFPAGLSLDRVESVCTDESLPATAVAGLLARLVEQSLVQAGEGRFWLLETLRTYARERLAATGEEMRLRGRHAHDTAGLLAELDRRMWTPAEATGVAAVVRLGPDLQAAWGYAVEHDRALAVRLAGDVYDFAYGRQRLDLLSWGLYVAGWDITHRSLPRAMAAASAAAWAGGRLAEAESHAERGVAAARSDPPSAARAVTQQGNIAMFRGQTRAALAHFRTAGELHRTSGEHGRALADEVSVAQTLVYAGHAAEARRMMDDVLPRTMRAASPSLLAWAHYIVGETLVDVDVERALAAYATAISCADEADCRLFAMLARGSSVALAARSGAPAAALDQFDRIFDQQERVGNELVELWVLRFLVVLLDRVGAFHDAAVLAGAVLAVQDRYPVFGPYESPIETAVGHLRDRLGATATDDALQRGSGLAYPDTVAHARRSIRAAKEGLRARQECAPCGPRPSGQWSRS